MIHDFGNAKVYILMIVFHFSGALDIMSYQYFNTLQVATSFDELMQYLYCRYLR